MLRWMLAVMLEWTMIALLFALATVSPWLWPLVACALGTRQHALAILAHEGAHCLIAPKRRRLNDWLANALCLWPLGVGMRGYREFHLLHHWFLGTERDPELEHRERLSRWQWRSPIGRWKLTLLILADFCGLGILEVSKLVWSIPRRGYGDWLGPAVVWTIFVVSGIWFPVVLLWPLALVTSFWAVFRLRAWTEHVGSTGTHATVVPAWWQRAIYLPHNTWCHAEHHATPGVAFWRLPEVSR